MVIVRPYFSLDPSGPNYEKHCRQKLIRLHQPRRTSALYQPHRTSRSSRAWASIAFKLTLAPTMQCIHLAYINQYSTVRHIISYAQLALILKLPKGSTTMLHAPVF